MMTFESHVKALHTAQRADHEEWRAKVVAMAEQAAAAGDIAGERDVLEQLARLDAIPKPWLMSW